MKFTGNYISLPLSSFNISCKSEKESRACDYENDVDNDKKNLFFVNFNISDYEKKLLNLFVLNEKRKKLSSGKFWIIKRSEIKSVNKNIRYLKI